MSCDTVAWVHEPDGQVLNIPAGGGEHLRPLGWHPLNDKHEPVHRIEDTQAPTHAVAQPRKTTRKATSTRKSTLK